MNSNRSGGRAADGEGSRLPTDEALVQKLREGDSAAAEELIRRYRQKGFGIACTLCDGDRDAALDYTQEAFVKVLGSIGSFQGKSSFYTWFYRILVNTCLDGRRKRTRWERLIPGRKNRSRDDSVPEPGVEDYPAPEEAGDPYTAVRGGDLARDLDKALEALPEKQRTVFQLKVLHGMALSEIARMTGAAQGTVKTHLFRATRALREALSDWREDNGADR
ncbi:RNA polymerase sigma factor [Desulfococcus sp.]|uniref:RNA polymerase sigma factor n=1 Tax=Desulfococcus sp. TaxID=2025834 RepID=UPI0035936508